MCFIWFTGAFTPRKHRMNIHEQHQSLDMLAINDQLMLT